MTRLVGLTGGIACGKSLVSANLDGIPLIDCDQIAHESTKRGSWGWRRVKAAFKGHDVFEPDGSINRKKLGTVIFFNEHLRRRLNKATHLPITMKIGMRIFIEWLKCTSIVVIDMPLLFETRSQWLFSDIIVVTCSEPQQLQRLCRRDGLSRAEAKARVDAQMPSAYKAAHSTILIDNSGSQEDTAEQVKAAVYKLKLQASFWRTMMFRLVLSGGAVAAVALLRAR